MLTNAPWSPAPYLPGHVTLGQQMAVSPTEMTIAAYATSRKGPGFPTSFGMSLAGAGTIYAGQFLPGDIKTPAILVGVGLAGYGAYGLYQALLGGLTAAERPTFEQVPRGQNLDAYRRLTGSIILPPKDGGIERSLGGTTYPVRFRIVNQSGSAITAHVRLVVKQFPRVKGRKGTSIRDYTVTVPAKDHEISTDESFPIDDPIGLINGMMDAVAELWIMGIEGIDDRVIDSSTWIIE